MANGRVRLLALDGGGVRGLSSLMILQQLMININPDSPPRPHEYFDMIGGTSTGGLIAVMLGRLQMSVDECIEAYTTLADKVFKSRRGGVRSGGKIRGRFDATALEKAIKQILISRGLDEDALLQDAPTATCKVFVCAMSKESTTPVCLTSYRGRSRPHLLSSTTIWQACRATSAATSFFDPISLGPFGEEFVDGALGANNPVNMLWTQAQDLWGPDLQAYLQCLVSVGTGLPSLKPYRDDIFHIWTTIQEIVTDTEITAEQFRRQYTTLDDQGRYFRFNVNRGLEDIGLEESRKKKEIAAATSLYIESQEVFKKMDACARSLNSQDRPAYSYMEMDPTYESPCSLFSLEGAPGPDRFVDRSSDMADLEQYLLPKPLANRQQILILNGVDGSGKTQLAADFARRHKSAYSSVVWLAGRSENRLKHSIASCVDKIEGLWLKRGPPGVDEDVATVLNWFAAPDNTDWLLIIDNVGGDAYRQGASANTYDIRRYLPGGQGSILITTPLKRLAQLGYSKRLGQIDEGLAEAIFREWGKNRLPLTVDSEQLTSRQDLKHLPLALAQAASYLRETRVELSAYLNLYAEQRKMLIKLSKGPGMRLRADEKALGTICMVSLRVIEERNPSATNLVRLWAFLDSEELSFGFLQGAARGNFWPKWLREVTQSRACFMKVVTSLSSFAMIESRDEQEGIYSMHPFVHSFALWIQDRSQREEFAHLALMLLGSSQTMKSPYLYSNNDLYRALLPHAERCSAWLRQGSQIPNVAMDRRSIGAVYSLRHVFLSQGNREEAEQMYLWALDAFEETLGLSDELTITTAQSLGDTYKTHGKLLEAEEMYLRVLRGKEASSGLSSISTLETVKKLGDFYKTQQQLKKAEEMYKRALQGFEATFGLDSDQALEVVYNLRSVYLRDYRLDGAVNELQARLVAAGKPNGPQTQDCVIL